MTNKLDLLRELRIDRSQRPRHGTRLNVLWWLTGGIFLLVGCAAGLMAFFHSNTVPVRVVVAHPLLSPTTSTSGDCNSILDASGYVVARRQATVSAKITGKLDQLFIEEGQHVKIGEVLAKLDDSNAMASLMQAKATVAQSKASVLQAQTAFEDSLPGYLRNQKEAAAGIVSSEALEVSKANYDAQRTALAVAISNLAVQEAALQVAQRNEDDTVVRAPFDGVITTKNAQPGEIISPLSAGGGYTRSGIGTLVDMDSLEVDVDVNENFISAVHINAPAILKLNAYPDWKIPAYVIAVVPTADRNTATFKVRLGFKLLDPRILPEMGARVSFLSGATRDACDRSNQDFIGVVLPVAAVQLNTANSLNLGVVFVLHDATVERRVVKLGTRQQNEQSILSGISSGERVAIGDFSKLSDGMRIKIIGE